MKIKQPWPGKDNPVVHIEFELMMGFDDNGQPIYRHGKVMSKEECQEVRDILEPLSPASEAFTCVTMGKVYLTLQDSEIITLRPLFHPSLNIYRDIFKVDEDQYYMPDEFADILHRWRSRLLSERTRVNKGS